MALVTEATTQPPPSWQQMTRHNQNWGGEKESEVSFESNLWKDALIHPSLIVISFSAKFAFILCPFGGWVRPGPDDAASVNISREKCPASPKLLVRYPDKLRARLELRDNSAGRAVHRTALSGLFSIKWRLTSNAQSAHYLCTICLIVRRRKNCLWSVDGPNLYLESSPKLLKMLSMISQV